MFALGMPGPLELIIVATMLLAPLAIAGIVVFFVLRKTGASSAPAPPCPHCGGRTVPQARFCHHCGRELTA